MSGSGKTVGYLGPEGTFCELAARTWTERSISEEGQPGEEWTLCPYPHIPEVLMAVSQGEIESGVVPLENSIEGSVHVTLDLLFKLENLYIQGEVVLVVDHHLVGRDSIQEIKRVYSHPQAIAQCQDFLRQNLPWAEISGVQSTAQAAVLAARERGAAAISSRQAAEKYGLNLLASRIQDYGVNQTRFAVVGREMASATGKDKTSLVLALPQDQPGGLFTILQEFAQQQINLTRIESRPAKKELGEYVFFLDCQGHAAVPPLKEVLDRLLEKIVLLRVLGSYPMIREGGGGHV